MNTFCTIITRSHIPFAKALFGSLQRFLPQVGFIAFIVDDQTSKRTGNAGIKFFNKADFDSGSLAKEIEAKYYHRSLDKYRWAMKPVFITQLLQSEYEKVIYLDSDIYFFDDPAFLFDALDENDLLLTPQWRCLDQKTNPADFYRNFYHGLYNAGFVGASTKGLVAMDWWASACLYKCEKSRRFGLYDDQAYLNLFPVLFENVNIIKHRGCNVANWNIQECRRCSKGEQVMINNTFPVVFVHFAHDTIKGILNGEDPLLRPHLEAYNQHLRQLNNNIDLLKQRKKRLWI